jgi:hypothetical protein
MERPDLSRKGPRKRLKPHLIRSGAVAKSLEGSLLTAPVFHCTSLESTEHIIERGIDLWRNRTAVYGRGFYLSSQPIERYGPGIVRAAVKLRNPLVVPLDEFPDLVQNWGVAFDDPDAIRQQVLARGFDGIIVKGADFNRANQEVDIVVVDVRTIRIIAD